METGVYVLDAMTKLPVNIHSMATIADCAKKMHEHNVGSLVVLENNTLAGIITERDITRRVLANDLHPAATIVKDVMTTDLVTVSPDADISKAIMHMTNFDIRHMPVLANDQELVGFITMKDILKIHPDLFETTLSNWRLREEDEKPIRERYYNDVQPYYE